MLAELRERQDFLTEMRELGGATDEIEAQLQSEISQRLRRLKVLDRVRIAALRP